MSNSFKETRNLTTSDGLSRRGFMIGTVGTGVAMAFVPMTLLGGSAEDVLNHQAFEPTLWYRIDPSGGISVKVTKAEMGQHIGTALARIVAEELEADWEDVSVDYVDTDPKYGLFLTGGSWSVWTSFDQLSRAGAAGRVALIEEGARLLGVGGGSMHRSSVTGGLWGSADQLWRHCGSRPLQPNVHRRTTCQSVLEARSRSHSDWG